MHTHTHTHTGLKNSKTQPGTGIMLQTGNRWPAGGKKRGRKKEACQRRGNVSLPSFMPPSLPPSSLYPQLEGKGRPRSRWRLEARSAGSGRTSKWTSSLGEFLKMALLYWSELAPAGCDVRRNAAEWDRISPSAAFAVLFSEIEGCLP